MYFWRPLWFCTVHRTGAWGHESNLWYLGRPLTNQTSHSDLQWSDWHRQVLIDWLTKLTDCMYWLPISSVLYLQTVHTQSVTLQGCLPFLVPGVMYDYLFFVPRVLHDCIFFHLVSCITTILVCLMYYAWLPHIILVFCMSLLYFFLCFEWPYLLLYPVLNIPVYSFRIYSAGLI
jgi:hypothetical protein